LRRAVVAGVSAFIAVALAGSVLVRMIQHAQADAGTGSPTPSASGSPGPEPQRGPYIDAYLVWVPGGLPPGFGGRLGALSIVDRVTVVAADNVWMTSSNDGAGNVVDQPPQPYMIPLDAAAIDPLPYSRFLPPEARPIVAHLQDGQAILGQTSARLRNLGPGGVIQLQGGSSVTVIGVLPDRMIGAAEIVVTRTTGVAIGVRQNRYALFRPSTGLRPGAQQLVDRFRALLPPDVQYPVVQVRAPGETKYLRMGDAVLPPALIKQRFGEWSGRPQPGDAGYIEIDPTWVQEHIATAELPILGRVSCNRKLLPQLEGAMDEVVAQGLSSTIHSFDGCFSSRFVLRSPSASISHHAWGVAVDINADTNRFGTPPTQDPRLVTLMERWGFAWGGDWIVPDGMHFEYLHPPDATG
jgi:hypothetical protein